MQNAEARVEEITKFVTLLPGQDQAALLKALRKQFLLAQAKRLEGSVGKNDISMRETLEIVSQVRKAQHTRNGTA
ncbi:MAG: hypothetical protein K9J37_14965 [Saprospiraceae bacterium]|nr:hypothetical protein [Saprospiraceae bacterium]MCF8251210.1 hypothetical protein [Saprospiraceae bacterium]MCF8281194.1 hypothetical protein [Bacteroidales bacterium]MCF8313166.1 hypothetical protein [Saprospiraceae bacterium]MCF8441572.1 hypothetical protein [Saprospiraceae bacterium]